MAIPARSILAGTLLALVACGSGSKSAPSGPGAVRDREWQLVALGDRKDPAGAGGQPVTLKLDSASTRASGFGGCNRYTGGYQLEGEKLTFGPLASTKMYCEQGSDVEDKYLPALGSVQTWEIADGLLVLKAAGVPVLRFRAAAP